MKSSGRGPKQGRLARCLIVDGYNILPRLYLKSLREIGDLEMARNDLADRLCEYSAFRGEYVVLVFDAHHTENQGTHIRHGVVDMYFTQKKETADERIEALVYEMRDVYGEISVATSDAAEQQVVFGGGALRISADELRRRLEEVEAGIRASVKKVESNPKSTLSDNIRQDVANILEKWRRW
jgi:uncharacterized protein